LFLNGEQIMSDELEREIGEHDVIEILTAIAGG
jgi:sulfur carrier protein ThiS